MRLSINDSEFRKKLRRAEKDVVKRTENLAELIAGEVVNHARSLTNMRKPDGRLMHPGNWADITSNLAGSIKGKMNRKGRSVYAIIEATMEYAAELDARKGYDVLGGADIMARNAIKKHAPELFR